MTMGVCLFGSLASFIANKLLTPDTKENGNNIYGIRLALKEQTRQNEQIHARLDRNEQKLNSKPP